MTIHDFVPSVTEAQMKLHAAMRRDTDPRWEPGQDIIERRWSPLITYPLWMAVGVAMWFGCMWASGVFKTASAAEQPRPWIVWDIDANKPWVSAKGYQSTATGPTACNLNLHEASKASPSGSRLSCRRIDQQRN